MIAPMLVRSFALLCVLVGPALARPPTELSSVPLKRSLTEELQQRARESRAKLKACYLRSPASKRGAPAVRIVLRVEVNAAGRVTRVEVNASRGGDRRLGECLRGVAAGWRVLPRDAPEAAELPLIFSAAGT